MKMHRNAGFTPRVMVWACALVCSTASLAVHAASAEIVLLIGKGERRESLRAAWLAASVKQKLGEGEFVRTLADSQMALFMPDRTQIRLNQNSQLELKSIAEAADWSQSQLRLNAGRAWSQARPQASTAAAHADDRRRRLTIETPTVSLGIRGTDWEVEVEPDGRTQLVVLSGLVEMSNSFGSIEVGRGEAATAQAGQAPVKRTLIDPKSRVQWVSSWRPQPRHWAGEQASRFGAVISRIENGEIGAAAADLRLPAQTDPVAAGLLADLLLYQGQAAQARAVLTPSTGDAGAHPRNTVLLAYAMAQQDQVPQALELLAAALARTPGQIDLLLAQGDLFILEGDAQRARSAYDQALAVQPASAEAWYGLGVIESERENLRQARAALAESLRLRPDSGKAAAELAAAETFAGDLAAGRRLLGELLAREPDNYRALTALGLVDLKSGQAGQALQDFMKAGVIEPRYSRAWLYSGVAFYQQGERARAMDAFRKAGDLDPRDPMPYLYTSVVQADALEFGQAIASARQAQERMPFLKSLNQAASNQKGNANLGSALANFGMEEWAGYYADQAYSPYWGASHLFLADRHTGKFNKNSELFKGFLTDPLAFGASSLNSDLISAPGNHGRIDAFVDRGDWTQLATQATLNGLRTEPTPIAYFVSGDLAGADANRDGSVARGRNFTLGLGIKPRHDLSLFGFATDSRLRATVRTAALTDNPMVQTENRADIGLNFKLSFENQFWLKAGSGRQDNELSGFIVSQSTADALNRALATQSILPNGTLDAFNSGIEQRDVQFRHSFTSAAVQWTWGLERSRQRRSGQLATTFSPVRLDVGEGYGVDATDAYLSARLHQGSRFDAQADLFHQSARLHRRDATTLELRTTPAQAFTIEDTAANQRISEWNPRVGVKWQLAPLRSIRAVFQKWRRPASAATLSPVDTLGVALNDRLVNAGGLYQRARLQFDAELGHTSFVHAFLDHERVDNGLGGRRSAISDFEVTQLESLRRRPDVFTAQADLEDTPQFAQGRVDSLGIAANHLISPRQSLSARYLFRDGEQTGTHAGLALPYVPRHFLRLAAQWTLPGKWLLGASAAYRSERFEDADNLQRLAPGWAFGLSAYWESADKRSSVQAILDNLLTRRDAAAHRDPHLMLRYSYSY